MQNVHEVGTTGQAVNLSKSDRRLLIRASLQLFLRRLNHNLPVNRTDLLRVAYYAEDLPEQAA